MVSAARRGVALSGCALEVACPWVASNKGFSLCLLKRSCDADGDERGDAQAAATRAESVSSPAVAPAFERASLRTGEQLARQRLRLEADRLDLRDAELKGMASRAEKLQLKIRQDEEGLREITRIVGERGANARAVQLGVFPKSDSDTMATPAGESRLGRTTEFSFIP